MEEDAVVMPDNLTNRRPRSPDEFLGHFGYDWTKPPTGSFAHIVPWRPLRPSRFTRSSGKPKRKLTAKDAKENQVLTTDH
jgi:hypothetical protein